MQNAWRTRGEADTILQELAAAALAPAGVEVVVRALSEPTGARATALFRDLGAERAAAGLSPLRFLAGFGGSGVAVARSTLTPATDGLAGRLVVGAPLPDGNRGVAFDCLKEAPLLCILGDRDDAAVREGARRCSALRTCGPAAPPRAARSAELVQRLLRVRREYLVAPRAHPLERAAHAGAHHHLPRRLGGAQREQQPARRVARILRQRALVDK